MCVGLEVFGPLFMSGNFQLKCNYYKQQGVHVGSELFGPSFRSPSVNYENYFNIRSKSMQNITKETASYLKFSIHVSYPTTQRTSLPNKKRKNKRFKKTCSICAAA